MNIEYWLQKKTLGGWSHVTWYETLAEAETNLERATKGDTGYSWRIAKAEIVREKLLDEVTPITKPEIEFVKQIPKAIQTGDWGQPVPTEVKSEHGLAGSVWMVHYGDKVKKRVPAHEQADYEAKGFVKGGPRTII